MEKSSFFCLVVMFWRHCKRPGAACFLLVVTHGAPGPKQLFGQVYAVNFGNGADFLQLFGNAHVAFCRSGQRRVA